MKTHPHDLLLQEFALNLTGDPEEVLEHLIVCASCQRRLKALLHPQASVLADRVVPLERRSSMPPDYEPGLDRVSRSLQGIESSFQQERAEAPGLFSELWQHPVEKRPLLVRNCPRFQTWGLCELLLRRGREQNFHNPAVGESLALLALEVLDRLDSSCYGKEALEDLRARAWAYVANSRRVKADLRGAEEAFALSLASLRRGTQDPMDRAVLLDLRASLLRAQRRFPEALRGLRRALGIFRNLGESHRAGRALLSMSIVHHFAGEPEKAIPLLYEALELIDPSREPRLLLVAGHNLIDDLAEAGQFMEAQKMLIKARPLYQQFPQPWSQNPRKWVEGKIARGLGQRAQAEKLFLAARDGFLLASAAYDTALVSLDLASLYAEQGRMSDLKHVAEEMVPIFSSRQIHREALAALAFWRQAVEAERAGLELVAGVASFLKRARYDPALRFEKTDQEI
jgi:tetratricopeptide (TPR) repeat protein